MGGAALVGPTWTLSGVDGEPSDPDVTTALRFGADGRVVGTGGVNRLTGTFEATAADVTFGAVATTRMAGLPRAAAQERAVLAALAGTVDWSVDDGVLTLGRLTFVPRAPPDPDRHTVSGNVLYRPRVALAPGAVVTVQVRDVSRADAPAATLGEQRIEADHQVPIPLSIEVPVASFAGVVSATVGARIEVDGRLAWISDTHRPVARDGPTVVDVVVVPVGT